MPSLDERWTAFEGDSLRALDAVVAAIVFLPEVPRDVARRFELVRSLIRHSKYDYEFLDAAYERTLFSFELALKLRYRELNPLKKDPSNLKRLIEWGSQHFQFESSLESVDALRSFRNRAAHPEKHTLTGILALHVIREVVELINGMYEDASLRKQRLELCSSLNDRLSRIVKEGGILETSSVSLLVFKALLIYIDNISMPIIYHFLCWPIFDAKSQDDEVSMCEPLVIPAVQYTLDADKMILRHENGEESVIRPIQEVNHITRMEEFKSHYFSSPVLDVVISHRIGEIRSLVRRPA